MITGTVNSILEPVIAVHLADSTGQVFATDAIVDTGFTGHLFLPLDIINALKFPWITREQLVVTGGYVHFFEVYRARILWDGILPDVDAIEADGMPLVGTALLHGYSFGMETRIGGSVSITRL
jgi:clan AA aspartic protease